MTERITPRQFHPADGVGDWRVLLHGACAHFRTGSFWLQQMDAPRPQRNRIHVDVSVPHDQAEARIAAAIAAGGHLVSDEHAPAWRTLAGAEGNEVDVATWMGRN
jgi:4a-hydroxytetrahydrobiopterin dehydratase